MEDPISDEWYYGLGLLYIKAPYPAIGHQGDYLGASSWMYYLPDSDVTVVMGTNRGMVTLEGYKLFKQELLNEVAKVALDQ